MFMHLLSNVLVVFRKKKFFHFTYPLIVYIYNTSTRGSAPLYAMDLMNAKFLNRAHLFLVSAPKCRDVVLGAAMGMGDGGTYIRT